LSNSRDVSVRLLFQTLVVKRLIKLVRRSISSRSIVKSPGQRVFLDRGRSCAPWSRFACSGVAIDNRTNPGKTSPPLLQAQGLVSTCGVGPPPTANGKSQQKSRVSWSPAFLPKDHSACGKTFCSFQPSHRFQSFGCCQLNTRFYQGIDLSFPSLLVSLKPNKPYRFSRSQRAPGHHDTAIRLGIELQVGSPAILSRSSHPQSLDCFLRFSYTILAHTAVP
jgi:hypothetical protein